MKSSTHWTLLARVVSALTLHFFCSAALADVCIGVATPLSPTNPGYSWTPNCSGTGAEAAVQSYDVPINALVKGGFVCGDAGCVSFGATTAYQGQLPSTWTNVGGVQTPPSTAAQTSTFTVSGHTAATLQGAGEAYAAANSGTYCGQHSPSQIKFAGPGANCTDGWGTVNFTTDASCPAGYTASGAACNLSNASLVQKPMDGHCGVIRTGNVYGVDPRDPDCASSGGTAAQGLNLSISGGTVTAGTASATLSVSTNVSTGVTTITSATAGTGTTIATTLGLGAPSGTTAAVVGTATSTTKGTGTGSTETATGECGAPGQPPCRIDESGTPGGTGFQSAGKDALDGVTPGSVGVDAWTVGASPSPWGGLPSFSGSADCTNPTATFFGHSVTVNYCAVFTPLKTILAWVFYCLTALYCWRRVTQSV